MTSHDTALWTVTREGRRVSCLVRLTPYGFEIDIAHDGAVILTRAFEHDTEALAWAERKREARAAEGWIPVDLPPEPKV